MQWQVDSFFIIIMSIPNDPFMLYSFINMKLRDEYDSFAELCKAMSLDEVEISKKLASAGFEYSAEHNKFW